MIKSYITYRHEPKVIFRGSAAILKGDIIRILWSMIQKSPESRLAVIQAIQEINDAVSQMEGGEKS